jgi:hypothetical protein
VKHPNGRDPAIDHPHELYPEPAPDDDLSEILTVTGSGMRRKVEQVLGDNVDDDGVAHFLRITPDPEEPDLCGGCEKEWPCPGRVPLQVMEQPRVDSELLAGVVAALKAERDAGRLAL